MKSSSKSNLLNYEKFYHLMLLALTFCFLYIGINFFLPFANYLSFLCLGIGLFYFVYYLLVQKKIQIIISLCFIILFIILSFVFYYL